MPDVIEYKILFMKKFKMQHSQKFCTLKISQWYVWQVYIINEKWYIATVLASSYLGKKDMLQKMKYITCTTLFSIARNHMICIEYAMP